MKVFSLLENKALPIISTLYNYLLIHLATNDLLDQISTRNSCRLLVKTKLSL